jgi:hypothetical protein
VVNADGQAQIVADGDLAPHHAQLLAV